MTLFSYLFWPNPGIASYENPKVIALFALCGGLVLLSVLLRIWRARYASVVSKRLSRSWPGIAFGFGLSGFVFMVARTEGIQFVAMRIWWVVWVVLLALLVALQARAFRARYYEVLPSMRHPGDPLEKYLPQRRRQRRA